MEEKWRVIPGCNGRYEASDLARVRRVSGKNLRQGDWRILKTSIDKKVGYVRVKIMRNDNTVYNIGLHQLIAAAFLGPCPEGLEVDHVDRCKLNNKPENLEYVTHAENLRRAREQKNWHPVQPTRKLTMEQAAEIRQSALSNRALGLQYGLSNVAVYHVKAGHTYKVEALCTTPGQIGS